jgi:PAS domain S-box-containing protein
MADVLEVPLHLAVHVSGLAVAAGLVAFALARRDRIGSAWIGLVVGGALLGVSHLSVGALVGEGLAWPLYLRAAGYAALAVGAATRVAILPAAMAVPLASHVVAAATGALAALATIGGVLGRGREVVGLSLGIALWALGDLLGASAPLAADAVSLAGSLVALVWLTSRSRESLATRFIMAFGSVLLIVVIVLSSAAAVVFDRDLRTDRLDLLQQQASARADVWSHEAPGAVADALAVLADSASLPTALAAGTADDDTAADVARVVQAADLVVLLDPDGRVAGSYDRSTGGALGPAETTLAGAPPAVAAQDQRATSEGLVRLELEGAGTDAAELLAIAAQPLFQRVDGQIRQDRPGGVVVAAQRVTRRDRLDAVAAQTGAEVAVLADDALAGATTGADAAFDRDLAELSRMAGGDVVTLAGRSHFVAVSPLVDLAGARVGSIVLFEDATVVADLERLVARVLFLAAVFGGAVATLLAGLVTARTTRPVVRLTEAAEHIAAGDLSARVISNRVDEVGRLAVSFDRMAAAVEEREQALTAAATREGRLRARLQAVTESISEALLAVDPAGTVTMANAAAADLLGRGVEDLIGAPLDQVVDGHTDDDRRLTTVLGGPDTPDVRSARGIVRDVAGRRRDVAATAAPLHDGSGASGRVYVLRDITGEAEVDRMKTEFLANASHELNTPLTPIIGYADTLARRPDLPADRRAQFVGEIRDSAHRLRRIVGMLVDFAELEAGRAHVRPEPSDVAAVVDAALERWRGRHPDRTYRRRVRRGLPLAMLDPRYTGRVLDELLDNATKFSHDTILVSAEATEDGRVRLGVHDRGIGIDEAALDEIRGDFRQGDASATRSYGGLGLGLAIVERILERQNGELRVESRIGQGTHVEVILPTAS